LTKDLNDDIYITIYIKRSFTGGKSAVPEGGKKGEKRNCIIKNILLKFMITIIMMIVELLLKENIVLIMHEKEGQNVLSFFKYER